MSGVSNSDIIRKAYEDFAQGDVPAVFAAFDPSHVNLKFAT